jgi:hypothetical protein
MEVVASPVEHATDIEQVIESCENHVRAPMCGTPSLRPSYGRYAPCSRAVRSLHTRTRTPMTWVMIFWVGPGA